MALSVLAARPTFPTCIRYLAERGEYGTEIDPEEEIRNGVAEADRYRTNERVRPNGRALEIRQVPVAGGSLASSGEITPPCGVPSMPLINWTSAA